MKPLNLLEICGIWAYFPSPSFKNSLSLSGLSIKRTSLQIALYFPSLSLYLKTLRNFEKVHANNMRRFFSRSSTGDSPQQELPSPEPPPPYPTPVSSNLHIGPARPIRFVYCDENGKFQIDPESIAVLQLVKEPVGVVSVCGRARQGKSFILNQVCSTKLTILSSFPYLFTLGLPMLYKS